MRGCAFPKSKITAKPFFVPTSFASACGVWVYNRGSRQLTRSPMVQDMSGHGRGQPPRFPRVLAPLLLSFVASGLLAIILVPMACKRHQSDGPDGLAQVTLAVTQ